MQTVQRDKDHLGAVCVVAVPVPYLFDGDAEQAQPPSGGLVEDAAFEERRVRLEAGFRVVVYTDGLLDAYGPLGDDGVVEIVPRGEFGPLASAAQRAATGAAT